MDFSLTEDHLLLRDAVQRFCRDEFPAARRGERPDPPTARRRRDAMAALGLNGLSIATEYGGSGQTAIEAMLVAQELGQALADWSFVSGTVTAAQLIARLGHPAQRQRWLPGLASGELDAALALHEEGQRYDWHQPGCTATPDAGGWVLQGRKVLVPGGDSAALLLVVARLQPPAGGPGAGHDAGDTLGVFVLDAATPGLQVQGHDTLDNRRAASLVLDGVRLAADRRLDAAAATPAIEAVLDAAVAALCAEAVGAVDALLRLTAEQLRTRKQFGAPLGKFQALQHRYADMAIDLEQLKSMACVAAMAVQADEPAQRRRLVSAAKVLASQKGRAIGLAAIQMHGAMGMTDECRVGHYAKRLLVIGQMYGDASWHLQRLQRLQTAAPADTPSLPPPRPR